MDIEIQKNFLNLAKNLHIKIYEPFSQYLEGSEEEVRFSLSLLDCYRSAGHACLSMTGAFLLTAKAIKMLFPETEVCERGDLAIEFGSDLHERATGPRSNVMSFITGAWGESGFPGLRGQFVRKNLVSYGNEAISKSAVKFRRISTGHWVELAYEPEKILSDLHHGLDFPKSWRVEIVQILQRHDEVVVVQGQSLF